MERRRAIRIPMAATSAQLMSEGRWTRAELLDLSLGGARLTARELPPAGARAVLQLSLAGRATRLEATVKWRAASAPAAGIAFDPLSPAQRRLLAEAMLRAGHHEEPAAGAVLVMVNGSPLLGEVSAAIHAHGFSLAVSATPLDAIQRLARHDPPIRGVIVSGTLASGSSEHMLGFLAAEHPDVRRARAAVAVERRRPRRGVRPHRPGRRADQLIGGRSRILSGVGAAGVAT